MKRSDVVFTKKRKGRYLTGPIAQHTVQQLQMQLYLPKKTSDLEDCPQPKTT